jgi:hypothetical protein
VLHRVDPENELRGLALPQRFREPFGDDERGPGAGGVGDEPSRVVFRGELHLDVFRLPKGLEELLRDGTPIQVDDRENVARAPVKGRKREPGRRDDDERSQKEEEQCPAVAE